MQAGYSLTQTITDPEFTKQYWSGNANMSPCIISGRWKKSIRHGGP
jgi:hypothetical protein